jgi:hypothetical protein
MIWSQINRFKGSDCAFGAFNLTHYIIGKLSSSFRILRVSHGIKPFVSPLRVPLSIYTCEPLVFALCRSFCPGDRTQEKTATGFLKRTAHRKNIDGS